jgi:acyl-CoA thioesterase II
LSDPLPAVARTGATDLAEALALEQIETNLFRANFVQIEDYPLFGGQVAAQALAAAGLTVPPDRAPHSLHGYFLRRGKADRPTVLRVERDRDGRSFSARRVVAIQQGEVIFSMAASFHDEPPGALAQSMAAPHVAPPEELAVAAMRRYPAIEVREEARRPDQMLPSRFWARVRHAMPGDELSHACALAYISDLSTGLVQLRPHLMPMASLDHALWIHQVPRVDEWLLVDLTGLVLTGPRGHYTGSIFTHDGRLVATLAQEMLVRRQ